METKETLTCRKSVAIIGAGPSGLTALKTCLDYHLDAVCFEKTAEVGGLWRYKPGESEASVMSSTVINSSKEMMAFSDFPPPRESPNFMHNSCVFDYFYAYAVHYDLLSRIHFNTSVDSVEKATDYDETGRMTVQASDMTTGEKYALIFDAVFVCTGHYVDPYVPTFEGQSDFCGQILHSYSYKHHGGYENKRVVVVGVGNSGCDIAVELSGVCKQVYLVTRRGVWVGSLLGDRGLPWDILATTRFHRFLKATIPSIVAVVVERRLNARFDHAAYGLLPDHHCFAQHPTGSDDLPKRLASGTVVVKRQIRKFNADGHSLTFVDGTRVEEIDTVILATGYTISFPVLADQSIVGAGDNDCALYKFMYPPAFRHPSLAIIGLSHPVGAVTPVSEMQARVACEFLLGISKAPFPSVSVMLKDISAKKRQCARQYVQTRRHTIQVDFIAFMDELADIIGVKPDISPRALLSDPVLWFSLVFGPAVSYQYRLRGRHRCQEARNAILTVGSRVASGCGSEARRDVGSIDAVWICTVLLGLFLTLYICNLCYNHGFRSGTASCENEYFN